MTRSQPTRTAGRRPSSRHEPFVLGIDAGGTMTDAFVVTADGGFSVGKAQTVPADESKSFLAASQDAFKNWGFDLPDGFSSLSLALYAGTTMLNTIINRRGITTGLIVTGGFEHSLLMGRGMQVWAGYSYSDRLHAVTHQHPHPLVPPHLVRGVTERVDMFGNVVIPLYEHEVVQATRDLLRYDVSSLCVCFLFSFVNPTHELRARDIIAATLADASRRIPVYLSHEVRPVIREHSRMNSVVIEAYAGEPARRQLRRVDRAIRSRGFQHKLRTVSSFGGLVTVDHPRLHETLISGPVGAVMGAQFIGRLLNEPNVIVADMGGTSFDVGVITDGLITIDPEPTIARFRLNLPSVAIESIGAGSGTIIRIDPISHRIELGPDSAGAMPGPVCFDQGGEDPTICDCDLILGYLNPDNFLGGKIRLNKAKAEEILRTKVADVLGADLYEACEGLVRMTETQARTALEAVISARGLDPSTYIVMGCGGSGPTHLAGFTTGLDVKGVLTFPFAGAFSAFGCTTADLVHRYSRTVRIHLTEDVTHSGSPDADDQIRKTWESLQATAEREFLRDGIEPEKLRFTYFALMRYAVQLDDLEVSCPTPPQSPAASLATLFEQLYERINRRVAKYRKGGFLITELGIWATVPTPKPTFPIESSPRRRAATHALQTRRDAYFAGSWHNVPVFDMNRLQPGNTISGPAIVEHPMTTLVLPPETTCHVDGRRFLWLTQG